MLGRIRKFSTSIYSKVFLFIVAIPFVFWGMGDLFSGGNLNTIVKIGKEKIHTQDFISYLRMKSLTTNELNDSQIIQQLLYSFIGERLILKEIDNLNAEASIERAGLTCNKNGVPFDPEKPWITSGVRLGSPAGTSRGFKEKEFELIGNLIGDVLDGLQKNLHNNSETEKKVKTQVLDLCKKFPIYSKLI